MYTAEGAILTSLIKGNRNCKHYSNGNEKVLGTVYLQMTFWIPNMYTAKGAILTSLIKGNRSL